MARIRSRDRRAITPVGGMIYGLLALFVALGCSACGRQPEASLDTVAAAPAATLPLSGQRFPATADTYISSWSPDTNYAAAKTLAARSDGAKSLLLRFDLTQATPAALDRAVLRLYVLRVGDHPLTLRAYPLLRPWDARAANWRQAASGNLWSLPGASDVSVDRAGESVALALVARQECWLELDLTALAREWLARPDRNNGLLLTGSALEAVECEFSSSKRRPEQSPMLELTFSTERASASQSRVVLCGAECGLADTTISASFPEANLAAAQTLDLAADGSRAILMRITELPKGDLEQATLYLYAIGGGPGNIEIAAHPLACDWQPQQASWLRPLASAKWASPGAQSPGADYAPILTAAASLNRSGGWLELDITKEVAAWLEHPELNDGLILHASGGSSPLYTFASVESPQVEQRPRLKLVYR